MINKEVESMRQIVSRNVYWKSRGSYDLIGVCNMYLLLISIEMYVLVIKEQPMKLDGRQAK